MTRGLKLILAGAAVAWSGAWIGLCLGRFSGGALGLAAAGLLLVFPRSLPGHLAALGLVAAGLGAVRGPAALEGAGTVAEGRLEEWDQGSLGTVLRLSFGRSGAERRVFVPRCGAAWLDRFPEGTEPGAWIRVRLRGTGEGGRAVSASGLEVLRSPGPLGRLASAPARVRSFFRERARQRLLGPRPSQAGAFLLATVAGDSQGFDAETWEDLRTSGLAHQAVVSGLQVGLLAWFSGLALAPVTGPRHRWRQAAAMIGAALSLLCLPADPPVRRAGWALLLVRLGRLGGRDVPPLGALGLVVLFLVCREPRWARSWSLGLTVSATAALVLAGGKAGPGRFWKAALAPMLATWPLLVFMTGQVAPWALIANLAALPATFPALLGGWGAVLLPAGSFFQQGSLGAALAAARWTLQAARLVAGLPGSGALAAAASPAWGLLHEALLAAWLLSPAKGRRRGLLLGLVFSWFWVLRPAPAGFFVSPAVEMLDVGQGQALLLRSGSALLLVDTGDDRRPEGTVRLLAHLRRRGIRRLDAVLLTQDDRDHAGGARRVLQALRPGQVLLPAAFLDQPEGSRIARTAARFGIPVTPLSAGSVWSRGALSCVVHHPPPGSARGGNESSLAAEFDLCGLRCGLTGDASVKTEAAIAAQRPLLPVAVLVAGHHGSAFSTSAELLAQWRPRLALISCGQKNRFGHPHPATLRRLQQARVPAWDTARWGSITVRRRGVRLEVTFPDRGTTPVLFSQRSPAGGA